MEIHVWPVSRAIAGDRPAWEEYRQTVHIIDELVQGAASNIAESSYNYEKDMNRLLVDVRSLCAGLTALGVPACVEVEEYYEGEIHDEDS